MKIGLFVLLFVTYQIYSETQNTDETTCNRSAGSDIESGKKKCTDITESFTVTKTHKCCWIQYKESSNFKYDCKRINNTEEDIKKVKTDLEKSFSDVDIWCSSYSLVPTFILFLLIMIF